MSLTNKGTLPIKNNVYFRALPKLALNDDDEGWNDNYDGDDDNIDEIDD